MNCLSQPIHKRTSHKASASASSVSLSSGSPSMDDSVTQPLRQPPADHISPSPTICRICEHLSSCGDTCQHMDPEMYRMAGSGKASWGLLQAKLNRTPQEPMWRQVTPQGNTILHLAACSGNVKMVRSILLHEQGQQLRMATNFIGDLPLHVAAREGHLHVVKELLITTPCAHAQSSDVLKKKNEHGDTALHLALRKHHWDVAEFLVKRDSQTSYILNNEEISPLYMAVEARCHQIVNLMTDDYNIAGSDHRNQNLQLKGKSIMHAALISKNEEILSTILKKEPALLDSRNEQGMSPLFFAALTGHYDRVCKLIEHSTEQAYQEHSSGLYPIHIASCKGYVNIVKKLLEHCPDSMELLVSTMEGRERKEMLKERGQNILHFGAKGDRAKMVKYLLKKDGAESLINHKDLNGNTPLHLAVINWNPNIVRILTRDTRVNLKLINNDGFTALDIAERAPLSTYRQNLTWMALSSAGVPRATMQSSTAKIPSNTNQYNNMINTLMLMATLVAAVTFSAGFTMPGGNASNPDQQQQQGMANLGKNHMFQVFVACDTVALYSSIVVAMILIWAQQSDLHLVSTAFKFALPLLGITLTSMSLAFMAGVYLAVSDVKWLANFVLMMGTMFLASFLVLFVPLFLPYHSSTRIIRYVVYCPFCLMVGITASDKHQCF